MPPFDPDFDADNPFVTDVPARFVYDPFEDSDFEDAYGVFAEATYDPDSDPGEWEGMEDAGMEFGLFGDC
jgi:hypothetical protein